MYILMVIHVHTVFKTARWRNTFETSSKNNQIKTTYLVPGVIWWDYPNYDVSENFLFWIESGETDLGEH